jgi:hypothetical protein
LSFFDEADEPRPTSRTTPRRRRPPGGGRRPPTDQQAIQIRRAIAAVVIIVVIIAIILGIHSCQVSARNSALRDYNNSVNSIIQRSKNTSDALFSELASNITTSNAPNVETQINSNRADADKQLSDARGLDVPSEVQTAQSNLLLTLQMRRDGLANIATQIQSATNTSSSQQAINTIALQMARFYASDVLYKDYTVPLIAAALNAALGSNNGATYNPAQFLPNLGWLTPSYVAGQLKVSTPASKSAKCTTHAVGHHINSVSVAGTALSTSSTNTIAASPPPTFTISITNGGQVPESNVMLKVTVQGTSVSGTATVPQTTPGATASGQVTLSSTPPTGTFTVQAEVVPVHCETSTTHNFMSFPVTFQ